jgi:hypothetical protein
MSESIVVQVVSGTAGSVDDTFERTADGFGGGGGTGGMTIFSAAAFAAPGGGPGGTIGARGASATGCAAG